MPYITQEERNELDETIDQLLIKLGVDTPNDVLCGKLNYFISKLIWCLGGKHNRRLCRYARLNMLIGVLGCVIQEFYRRIAAPYEDKKIKENGDL
jgi:hypothetical protein